MLNIPMEQLKYIFKQVITWSSKLQEYIVHWSDSGNNFYCQHAKLLMGGTRKKWNKTKMGEDIYIEIGVRPYKRGFLIHMCENLLCK